MRIPHGSAIKQYIMGVLVCSLLFFQSAHTVWGKGNEKTILIVDKSKAVADVLIADDATDQVKAAAEELVSYIKISTGADFKIVKESDAKFEPDKARIIVRTAKTQERVHYAFFAQEDAFSIVFPDNKTVLVSGKSDWGTEFAVYAFLERYVGIRWLMPGPDGDYVPRQQSLSVPVGDVNEEPAFTSRLMSGLKGPLQFKWARHNRMHGQISFHHNLYNLFPPSRYTKSHPEFYPMINGKRYLPPDDTEDRWQPCYTASGLAEEAVKNICDYFSKHPKEMSYSLGANDSSGYCECDACRTKSSGVKNYLGLQDFSDTYFAWANAVVEGVLKQYPDKWFGCLAYSELAQAPSRVQVHPRIVPFMTFDRIKWVDETIEKDGKSLTEIWCQKASVLGWGDYIYGTPYLVPRIYFHKMAEYYRYAKEHNVHALYSEAYPNWGEGPKLYIALKLQWDPYVNVDSLFKDWCEKAVGKDAAPYLETYYALWEEFWKTKVPKSKWFATPGQYLPFYEPGYVDLIEGEVVKSHDLLENVLAKATTDQEKKRANLLFKTFEYYEASVISYKGRKWYQGIVTSEMQGNAMYKEMAAKRLALINEFENNPILIHPTRFDRFKNLRW